jgi:diadenosine tetraphosphate (Ap4A) HIT family hydrolase
MALRLPAIALLMACCALAAVECACDPANPETMKVRQCSLCNEAEKQGADTELFFLKDNNPRKPNRWLLLPRVHGSGQHHLYEVPPKLRAQMWEAAVKRAKELWGDEWGLAYNGEKVRTQCHTHIHIGKLLRGVERDNFKLVSRPSEIPAPKEGGVWVHPQGKRLHVHLGEQTCETVLLR